MALPGVSINLGNGNLGQTTPTRDSICGLIVTGTAVSGSYKLELNKTYLLFSLEDAENLGIKNTGSNLFAHWQIREFYDKAGTGALLYLMAVASTVTMEDMLDKDGDYAPVLLDEAKGTIRKLGVSRKSASGVTIAGGLDEDVDKAMIKGQALAEKYADQFQPFRFIVDGKDFNGVASDLKDYSRSEYNRGAILLGTTDTSKNAAVGFTLGVLASLPVQRKLSRVRNGNVGPSQAYFTDTTATESHRNSWETIHYSKYIFFRDFVGRGGYYFNGDNVCTSASDDYNTLSRGFVIDKASVLSYQVFVNEIGEEIEVNDNGEIEPAIIKSLQGDVEATINQQMVANGELTSVTAYIDPAQNVLSTNKIKVTISVRPVGYADNIEVTLGFENPALQTS